MGMMDDGFAADLSTRLALALQGIHIFKMIKIVTYSNSFRHFLFEGKENNVFNNK